MDLRRVVYNAIHTCGQTRLFDNRAHGCDGSVVVAAKLRNERLCVLVSDKANVFGLRSIRLGQDDVCSDCIRVQRLHRNSRIASTRPVRAERARRRQSRRVCSTELFPRSCLVSEPAAHGTGAVALATTEGHGFHRRHGSLSLCREAARDACAEGCVQLLSTLSCLVKQAQHRHGESRCTVTARFQSE